MYLVGDFFLYRNMKFLYTQIIVPMYAHICGRLIWFGILTNLDVTWIWATKTGPECENVHVSRWRFFSFP